MGFSTLFNADRLILQFGNIHSQKIIREQHFNNDHSILNFAATANKSSEKDIIILIQKINLAKQDSILTLHGEKIIGHRTAFTISCFLLSKKHILY
ncbi:hypothetical protein CWS01_07045 [Niallia nealsonii]|uniref:Uncharacterized protein n=1 Tax=Niallia nealsonii TaxID=115979 RepID=A0A2N0Z4E5_9BACI|nr:hypothetical protein CWS01_07045 [Niallia nealsonii]